MACALANVVAIVVIEGAYWADAISTVVCHASDVADEATGSAVVCARAGAGVARRATS